MSKASIALEARLMSWPFLQSARLKTKVPKIAKWGLETYFLIFSMSFLPICNFMFCSKFQYSTSHVFFYIIKPRWKEYLLEWPMLWRITKNSLHSEGIYKWVNWAPIFFWYKLLPTTSGPQKFAKIRVVKVDYFDFPGEIFEKLVWIRR